MDFDKAVKKRKMLSEHHLDRRHYVLLVNFINSVISVRNLIFTPVLMLESDYIFL
jgi:hypothetical protein